MNSEHHNSVKRQVFASLLFGSSFFVLIIGMLLYWVEYAFFYGLAGFAILQILSIYIVTNKLRKSSND